MGLAALGYAMANETNPRKKKQDPETFGGGKNPMETFVNPEQSGGASQIIDSAFGHNNMVPFFGANMTQSMYSGATD